MGEGKIKVVKGEPNQTTYVWEGLGKKKK